MVSITSRTVKIMIEAILENTATNPCASTPDQNAAALQGNSVLPECRDNPDRRGIGLFHPQHMNEAAPAAPASSMALMTRSVTGRP